MNIITCKEKYIKKKDKKNEILGNRIKKQIWNRVL